MKSTTHRVGLHKHHSGQTHVVKYHVSSVQIPESVMFLTFCFWPSCWVSTQWLSSSKCLARGGRRFRCVHFCALHSQCLPKTVGEGTELWKDFLRYKVPIVEISSTAHYERCFVLLTRGWGRLETRPPVALGSSPELSAASFTMLLAPPVHPSPIFSTDTENL